MLQRFLAWWFFTVRGWRTEGDFPYALKHFEFFQLFEGILVSGEEMMKKPDPRIYQLILD